MSLVNSKEKCFPYFSFKLEFDWNGLTVVKNARNEDFFKNNLPTKSYLDIILSGHQVTC